MTREEVGKVLALLSAYYDKGQRTMGVKATVVAWEYVIGQYEYNVAKRAVINFARNDTREYATFPSAGLIRKAIEEEEAVSRLIFNSAFRDAPYEALPPRCKEQITEHNYKSLLGREQEELLEHKDGIIEQLKNNMALLEGARNGN